MTYILEYTVVIDGQVAQVMATDHADAANRFLAEPRYGKMATWEGAYTPEDGQVVTVVGYTQEAFRDRQYAASRRRDWEKLPEKGRGRAKGRVDYPEPPQPPDLHAVTMAFRYECVVTFLPVHVADDSIQDAA